MSERKPTDDLKDGLLLLVRAARGLSKNASTESFEKGIQTGAKELVRVINNVGRVIGSELEKAAGGDDPPHPKAESAAPPAPPAPDEPKKDVESKPS